MADAVGRKLRDSFRLHGRARRQAGVAAGPLSVPSGKKKCRKSQWSAGEAKLGETTETLLGEEARGSGFPLNCARHSGSLRQVPGPGLCVPFGSRDLRGPKRPLGAPTRPRLSHYGWPLSQPRLARRLPLNCLCPASAASVTSTWGRDFLLRAPLGLGTQPALRDLKGGGRRTLGGFLVGLWLRRRTPEKASPPRRSGVFLHCRRCPFRLRSSLGITHISRGREPEGRAWPSGSCSSACAASGRRDLARRDGLGLHPACGTVSRGPSAPAGRVP